MKTIKLFFVILVAVPILMVGCKKEAASASTSNVKFNLTDAPANFDALYIDVQSVQVHSTTSGWITIPSSAGVINILSYVNGNATLAAQGDITAGSIDQIRLVLGSNNSIVVNGNTYNLSAASSAALQAGLTINVSGQLQAGSNYVFTIDFDAAQSITATSSTGFQLNPVLRLIVDQTTTATTGSGSGSLTVGGSGGGSINIGGSIGATGSGSTTGTGGATGSGSVVISGNGTGNLTGSLSAAVLASVCVTGSNGSTFCTMTNAVGQFSMQALATGTYTVTITPTLPLLSAHTISNVSVTAGQTTNLGAVVM